MRRVVVTGLGLVTPLGSDVETVWGNILASKSGAGTIERFDPTDYACRIACEVKPGDGSGVTFDASKRVDHKIQRPEIGRASGRERVWQYVSISVVAGPLKKKKKK